MVGIGVLYPHMYRSETCLCLKVADEVQKTMLISLFKRYDYTFDTLS